MNKYDKYDFDYRTKYFCDNTNTILYLGTKRVVGEWGQEGRKGGGEENIYELQGNRGGGTFLNIKDVTIKMSSN